MNVPAPRPAGSRAAQFAAVILIGIVIGAVATVMLTRTWMARQDPFPDALMHVQSWHLKRLQDNVAQTRCAATDTLPHLDALRASSRNLEAAFPSLADDVRFKQAASGMRTVLDSALTAPPLNCPGVAALHTRIDEACSSCHRDFRG